MEKKKTHKTFTLLVIRETQTKTTRYYFTSTRMAIIKNREKRKHWQRCDKNWKTCALMLGMQKWYSHCGKQCGGPSKSTT